MHRWMASAAGGTSQRLKPGAAMIRSLDRKPGLLVNVPAVILLFIYCVPPRRDGQLTAHDLGTKATDRFLAQLPCRTRQIAAQGPVSGARVALASAFESKLISSFVRQLIAPCKELSYPPLSKS
ncbi:hypothetical protein D3C79_878050 [compost metagenome]